MKLLDILNEPWAIVPDKLEEIQAIYLTHLRGEKIDVKGIEAALGRPLQSEASGYTVVDGVAVLPIEGVISKRMNLFSRISGGVSTQLLQRDFAAALNDPTAHAIVLMIDSPGGEVDGTQAAANLIRQSRGQKPIMALFDGLGASAAYWIGSAADKAYIASDTTMVGSIGVVAKHIDYSRAEEARGVKVTEIVAGKYKRIASEHAPLSEAGRADIQEKVDHIYTVFVNDVAQNRGVSADAVREKMADGRVFLGQKAVDAGLVDGTASLEELIRKMNRMHTGTGLTGAVTPDSKLEAEMEKVIICGADCTTQEQVDAAIKTLQEKATADAQAQTSAAVEAERNRIRDVEAQALPGHETLIAELKFDGKTTGPEAAAKVLEAERKIRAGKADDLRQDAPAAAAASAADPTKEQQAAKPGDGDKAQNPQQIADKATAYIAEQKAKGVTVSTAEAVAHVTKEQPAEK